MRCMVKNLLKRLNFRPMFEFSGRAPRAGLETSRAVLWRPLLWGIEHSVSAFQVNEEPQQLRRDHEVICYTWNSLLLICSSDWKVPLSGLVTLLSLIYSEFISCTATC